jgi:hypothetical protein
MLDLKLRRSPAHVCVLFRERPVPAMTGVCEGIGGLSTCQ